MAGEESGEEARATSNDRPDPRPGAGAAGYVTGRLPVSGAAQPAISTGLCNNADGVAWQLSFKVTYGTDRVVMIVV